MATVGMTLPKLVAHGPVHTEITDRSLTMSVRPVASLSYADDVALLLASAQGLQQLLDSMQSFRATSGLAISIPKIDTTAVQLNMLSLVEDTMIAPGRWLVKIQNAACPP